VIADNRKDTKFDLIMVSTHAGPFAGILLGSTTAKNAQLQRSCPVLDTRNTLRDNRARSLEARKWLRHRDF